jgi:hypothetical protein
MTRIFLALPIALAILSILGGVGCVFQGPKVEKLGFLNDYTQMSPGRAGQTNLVFIDGEADFSTYSKIVVDPVFAWAMPGDEPTEATRALAKHFDEDLRRELALEFEVVDEPSAGTLLLRSALASRDGLSAVLEVEILDGETERRVITAVDQRDLEQGHVAIQTDAWAVLIRNRLATFRQFDAATRLRNAGDNAP